MRKVHSKNVSEEDIIRQAIKISGGDAYRKALKQGVTVTVLQGDKIQRVAADGKKETVGVVAKINKKRLATRIRLK